MLVAYFNLVVQNLSSGISVILLLCLFCLCEGKRRSQRIKQLQPISWKQRPIAEIKYPLGTTLY